jgi:butyryl-CoA dehydrogenase
MMLSRSAIRLGARSIARRAYTTHSQLPEEHRMVYEMCRSFADAELAPNAGEWDKKHQYPTEAIAKLSELGLMGICTPSEYNGSELDAMSYAIAMEEISRGCASVGVIMSAVRLVSVSFYDYKTLTFVLHLV